MKQERCAVCGETFDPHQVRQKFCSKACKQKAWREEKRNAGYTGTRETSHGAPSRAAVPFYDEKGALVDEDGTPLTRIWGPNTISDFQLANMGLERTGLTFPAGEYYRRIR